MLNWNVRGLNSTARQQVLRDLIADHRCTVVYVQETKLANVDDRIIAQALGPQFVGSVAVLPAQGISGGVIIGCSTDHYIISDISVGQYTVTAKIRSRIDQASWNITGVYGPQGDTDKLLFISEIKTLKSQMQRCYLVGQFWDTSILYAELRTRTMIG
jgi:exonuclease III